MKILQKIIKHIKNPCLIVKYLNSKKIGRLFPDSFVIKCLYKVRFDRFPNLKKPKTFNEKLQWLKLYDRKPEYTTMVDKYEVKKYIAERLGQDYLIPTLGVWDKFDDIDFDSLPDQFVLKCTHNSGGLIVCKDKSALDISKAKAKIEKSLKRNYFYSSREWPYKNVKPRIIAEKYMTQDDIATSDSLVVYKIFTFEGVPTLIQTIQNDKLPNESIDYFDTEWNLLDLRQNFRNSDVHLDKPSKFDEMLACAKKLSQGFHFLRVDFYHIDNTVYFSEFTFFSDSGMAKFEPEEWDEKLGSLIKLPTDA